MKTVSVEFRGTAIHIDEDVVKGLAGFGVDLNEMNPCDTDEANEMQSLVWRDLANRRVTTEGDGGLGRIITYDNGRIQTYDSLYEAIRNNWNTRLEMGFTRLHEMGITPEARDVYQFGVKMRVRNADYRIRALNNLVKDTYRFKNGVRGKRCYEQYVERCGTRCLSFDEFLHQCVRSDAFWLADVIVRAYRWEQTSRKALVETDVQTYREGLQTLLDRYSTDGDTAFNKVKNLNDYKEYTGVYVLALDEERHYYVGMTTKALKCRILEHFRRPNSDFDRTHTFEDVSEIYALCVHAKSPVSIDEVEADCIATLGPNLVCNSTAASPRLMEQLLCQPDLSSEMAERIIQSNLVHASTYSPGAFLLPDEKVAEVASGASDSKERCRRDSKESVPRGVKREDINDYIVEHHGLITQSEMARELGITTKAVERRVSRLRKAGRIPPRDTTR